MIRFLSWDHREGISSAAVIVVINSFQGGPIFAMSVEVGADANMIALSSTRITAEEAARRYDLWRQADFDDDLLA